MIIPYPCGTGPVNFHPSSPLHPSFPPPPVIPAKAGTHRASAIHPPATRNHDHQANQTNHSSDIRPPPPESGNPPRQRHSPAATQNHDHQANQTNHSSDIRPPPGSSFPRKREPTAPTPFTRQQPEIMAIKPIKRITVQTSARLPPSFPRKREPTAPAPFTRQQPEIMTIKPIKRITVQTTATPAASPARAAPSGRASPARSRG